MHVYLARHCHLREPPPPDRADDFRELFAGPPPDRPESAEEHAARSAAARDVLAELLHEGASDVLTMEDAMYALRLTGPSLLRPDRPTHRPCTWRWAA
ncbi:hypothetical protein [Streptomyces sp. NPDC020917]|uniref:hypothetical protein n=1 Tax=Streptomyces sp. NPDC020917 TaxID=3365102 RepID=UPI00378BF06E